MNIYLNKLKISKEKYIYFFDEIQLVSNWEKKVLMHIELI